MRASLTPSWVESSRYVLAREYLKGLAAALAACGLALGIATAMWLKPPPLYYPEMAGMLVVYGAAMTVILRRWVRWATTQAATTSARLQPRALSVPLLVVGGYLAVAVTGLGLLVAAADPKLLGFMAAQLLVFAFLNWRMAGAAARWEEGTGSRLLLLPRPLPSRQSFLIQLPVELPRAAQTG